MSRPIPPGTLHHRQHDRSQGTNLRIFPCRRCIFFYNWSNQANVNKIERIVTTIVSVLDRTMERSHLAAPSPQSNRSVLSSSLSTTAPVAPEVRNVPLSTQRKLLFPFCQTPVSSWFSATYPHLLFLFSLHYFHQPVLVSSDTPYKTSEESHDANSRLDKCHY